jgi:uncharacterized damage-inducible protein DinB
MIKNALDAQSPGSLTNAGRAIEGAISRMVQGMLAPPRSLSAEVDRFPAVRKKTLGILQQVTSEQALWRSRPGTWSIAQIADHLLRSDELYREQFRQLIQMAREGKVGTVPIRFQELDTSLAMVPREVIAMLEFPLRMFNVFVPHALREATVRYPVMNALHPKVSEPRAGLTLEKLREDLAESVVKTTKLLGGPMPPNLERLTVSHATMGNNSPVELFSIMIAHEERHQAQMQSLRSNANFPKAAVTPA